MIITKLLLLVNLVISVYQLVDSFNVVGSPDPGYLNGVYKLYPDRTIVTTFYPMAKGDRVLVYLRYTNGDSVTKTYTSYTGVFFPAVDDYSQMTIPNSNSCLT